MISKLQKPINSGFGAKSEPSEILEGIDLAGKTIMVTGGYSGIGLETSKALAGSGARVIVPARRVDVAVKELEGIVDKSDVLALDLANPGSVNGFVDEFLKSGLTIDVLINNAAVMACPEMPTSNGWDLQFAVNHIGHFILTKGLLPALKKSGNARVVTLSSTGHKLSGIRWDDLHFKNSYDKWESYGQSKTAASLLAVELDAQMKKKGIRAFAVHPGGIFTPLQRHLENEEMIALGWLGKDGEISEMAKKGFKSPSQGSGTTLWCATSPLLNDIGGVYCENCDIAAIQEEGPNARFSGVAEWAVDSEEASKLWKKTEEILKNIT